MGELTIKGQRLPIEEVASEFVKSSPELWASFFNAVGEIASDMPGDRLYLIGHVVTHGTRPEQTDEVVLDRHGRNFINTLHSAIVGDRPDGGQGPWK